MGINKVTFNAVDFWVELGAALTSAPEYPIPAEIKELVKIKGAGSALTEATGYFNDIEISLSFRSLKKFSPIKDFWGLKRKINQTFNTITDSRLQFSEYPNRYYKVKTVEVGAVTRISEEETDFEVNFICDAFLYDSNERPVTSTGTIQYNGDIPNAPIIEFTVGGNATYTVNVNGNALSFIGRQGRKIAINKNPYSIVTVDGLPITSTGNAPVFKNGSNTVSISGGSYYGIEIIKNERYLG